MSIVPPTDPGRAAPPTDYVPAAPRSSNTPLIFLTAVMVLGLGGLFYYAHTLSQRLDRMQQSLEATINSQGGSLQQLARRLDQADARHAELQGQFTVTRERLGMTQAELQRAHQIAEQLAQEQKASAEQISSQLGQLRQEQDATKGSLGALTSDITGVKGDVKNTQQQLAQTQSDLKRVVGDLGVTSDLVAKNRAELEDLKMRGERDYIEFDLRKSAKRQRVGNIQLELKKTDDKRQKYTINLITDDRVIEKKDRTALEPVQFYQQGQRSPTEIVVQQVYKDRITGYISAPKAQQRATSNREG